MTENCRKKMAISLVLTLPEPKVGSANSLPFSRMLPGVIRSRRNWLLSASLLAAVRSPLIFAPVEFLPEKVKTGMFSFSSTICDQNLQSTTCDQCPPSSLVQLLFSVCLRPWPFPPQADFDSSDSLREQSFRSIHPDC